MYPSYVHRPVQAYNDSPPTIRGKYENSGSVDLVTDHVLYIVR